MSQTVTTYYAAMPDGSIYASSASPFSEDFLTAIGATQEETTEAIVTGYDGKLYVEGTEPTPPGPTELEQIQAIQANYQAPLDTLMEAYTSATMLGDTADAAAIQSEYTAMLNQMTADITAITG